ncbi:MAG: ABC transporter ATP-binding protein [Lachnospiraceae bacterium]|nr:ABC transporter ATP-binding protein [Lachnospiraceae bacterium]
MDTNLIQGGDIFDILNIVFWLIGSLGYYNLFKKCSVKPLWSLVPVAREYHISLCAGKEREGRTYAILYGVNMLLEIINLFISETSILDMIISIIMLAVVTAQCVYMIRIFLGLCQVFERKKRWTWLWIITESLTAIIWGCSKSFEPSRKVESIDKDAGASISDNYVRPSDTGLTVNINGRTTIDFFKKIYLLRDIHLSIPEGHMVLLLGGSGAGKTTFVNAVTGYEQADASIMLRDKDLYRDYSKMKYDVGFVPQQDLMRGNDTVLRTLADAATLRLPSGITIFARKKRVHEVLEEFGLGAISGSLVEKLSGGQRKRLSIAMEYISDPSLFILDEPDSGLDGVVARGLFEKLRAIADLGKIVMVITHTPDRVIDLFDDVIVLAKDASRTGRLAYYGSVKDSYDFFGKNSMEEILLTINQKEEGGEGRGDEFVEKYALLAAKSGEKAGDDDE